MFICAAPVKPAHRVLVGQTMRLARARTGLKLDTIATLMGISKAAVTQMENGEREVQLTRIHTMRCGADGQIDEDGQRYVEAFTHAWAALNQVEQTDRLVWEVVSLFAFVKSRMVRANLGNREQDRRSA